MPQGNCHQLDASILVELFSPANSRNRHLKHRARGYLLGQVGKAIHGFVSTPALGEVVLAILRYYPDTAAQADALIALVDLIHRSRLDINSPNREAYSIALEVLENDYRIDPSDALRVAEAVVADAVLVTIDQKLLSSGYLKKRQDVKVIDLP